jgi:hypothetical protein
VGGREQQQQQQRTVGSQACCYGSLAAGVVGTSIIGEKLKAKGANADAVGQVKS